jgi:chromosome segregation ATPase
LKNKTMPTIEQLREDIASKQTALQSCSRELKDLTTQRANQQSTVTIKENKIHDLTHRSNLTTAESEKLATLTRELSSDKQELDNRERTIATCSNRETGLLFEVGRLKTELRTLETSGAIDYSKDSRRYGR